MRPETLSGVTLAVAQERDARQVVARLVAMIAARDGVALARVWLAAAGDVCATCAMAPDCPERRRCLHLAASAGTSRGGVAWTALDGAFRRIPLGVGKVGKVGATGAGMLLHDMSAASAWITRPDWAAREGMRSFAAQPLVARDEVLGVLAVFSRTRVDAVAFAWLRAAADHAAVALAGARDLAALEREVAHLRGGEGDGPETMVVGSSPATEKLLRQIELAAPADAPVLVVGEPGVGKDLVARRIHQRSPRASGPFTRFDCVAAHAGGAPALAARVAAADGGTLLLDEVAALAPAAQAALLAVLAGDAPAGPGPARGPRIVAATSRDLAAEAAAGRFDERLHLRLSVLTIVVPPLRERPRDVAPLVEHFLRRCCARLGRPALAASPRDLRALERQPWPGNVRELESVVERSVLLADGEHPRFELPPARAQRPSDDEVIPAADWRRRERANVESALARTGGRIYGRGGAAELLGVPPTTLASRVRALGIARPSRAGRPSQRARDPER